MKTILRTTLVFIGLMATTTEMVMAVTAPDDPANQSNITGQSVSQCLPDLRVCSTTLSSSKSGSTYTVTGKITVVESANPQSTIQGATVKVTWTRPNASAVSQSGVTNSAGIVSFSTTGPGSTYTLSVTGVSKTGYAFDSAGSTLTKSITN
jgi:hypothetical protein